jgi:hypothetical protein
MDVIALLFFIVFITIDFIGKPIQHTLRLGLISGTNDEHLATIDHHGMVVYPETHDMVYRIISTTVDHLTQFGHYVFDIVC